MRTIDPEILAIAQHELLQAFRDSFGELVVAYLSASEGLGDESEMKFMLQERTSIYGADLNGDGAEFRPTIYCELKGGNPFLPPLTRGYETLLQALQDEATKVYLQGRCIFEMADDGEWQVPDEEDK